MSIIIPYHEDLAIGGAFIKPNGEILRLKDNKHQEFAEDYCNGHDLKFIPVLDLVLQCLF